MAVDSAAVSVNANGVCFGNSFIKLIHVTSWYNIDRLVAGDANSFYLKLSPLRGSDEINLYKATKVTPLRGLSRCSWRHRQLRLFQE